MKIIVTGGAGFRERFAFCDHSLREASLVGYGSQKNTRGDSLS